MLLHSEKSTLPPKDDRREIWILLKRAKPAVRVRWLAWCCEQVSSEYVKTKVLESSGTVGEVWHEWASLTFGSGLSVAASGERLVRMVNGKQ